MNLNKLTYLLTPVILLSLVFGLIWTPVAYAHNQESRINEILDKLQFPVEQDNGPTGHWPAGQSTMLHNSYDMVSLMAAQSTTTRYVYGGWSEGNVGEGLDWDDTAFNSVNDAIYAANPGDTIFVYNGNYDEAVVVDKPGLTLQAESHSAVLTSSDEVVVDIAAPGVTVDGFTITATVGSDALAGIYAAGIYLEDPGGGTICNNIINTAEGIVAEIGIAVDFVISGSLTVENNTISGYEEYGIGIAYIEDAVVTITGNTVSDPACGILTGFISSITDSDVTIADNTVSSTEAGIVLASITNADITLGNITNADITIAGNEVTDSSDCGVYLYLLDEEPNEGEEIDATFQFADNIISGGEWHGLVIECPGDPDMINRIGPGNTITDNYLAGIYVGEETSDLEIFGNIIERNGDGIGVNGDNNRIWGNHVTDNTGRLASGIHLTDSAIGNIINFNDLAGNGDGIWSATPGVDAAKNWWGDANGPGHDGDAIGGVEAASLSYDPWITGATLTIEVGDTLQLDVTANLSDETSASATVYITNFTSDNPGVAGVTKDGLVTGLSEGTATITACFADCPTLTITVEPNEDTTPPTVPSDLTCTDKTSSSVSLTWDESTDDAGVAEYVVAMKNGSGDFTEIGTPATNSFTKTGLLASTTYSFRVKAVDGAGNESGWSNVLTVTTGSAHSGSGNGSGGGSHVTNETNKKIYASSGGAVSFKDVLVEVPKNTLPEDAYFSINKISPGEVGDITPTGSGFRLLGNIYEIETTGSSDFGDHTITINIAYDPSELQDGEVPVIHWYNGEEWVPLVTTVMQDQASGKWYAVTIVNHLTRFAVFGLKEKATTKTIELTINNPEALVDGKAFTLDAAPVIETKSGRAMVPVRFVSEVLGAEVKWNQQNNQVIILDEEKQITLTIGSADVTVEGNQTAIDCLPALQAASGRTFVPLRFISETLGAEVNYNETTKQIVISR